jgi:DNA-binding NtrC family response regulator
VTSLHIPPLRERKRDIFPLVSFFVSRYKHTAPRKIQGITKEFLKRLVAYDWPGNIRELENTVRSALALSKTHYLSTQDLKELGSHLGRAKRMTVSETLSSALFPYIKEALEKKDRIIYEKIQLEVDKSVLSHILSHTGDNQSEAARILGINRLTLRKKLRY